MTLALVIVTLASLAMVAALLAVVWRLLGVERRRSAARVAALESAIRGASTVSDVLPTPLDGGRGSANAAPSAGMHPDLFETAARPARASRNVGLIAGVGLIVVGTAVALARLSSRPDVGPSMGPTPGRQTTNVEAVSGPPLELVQLRHRRDGDALSITGIVRNPANGTRVGNLTAVVFLFDRDGGFLASGRAPIDYATFAPGDESPFVVTVKASGAVGRYRVSFRTDERVMPHVDRREEIAVARSVS